MSGPGGPPTPQLPERANARVALVLRAGLAAAVLLLLSALGLYLVENPSATSSSAIGSNPIVAYLSVPTLAQGLAAGRPEAYLALGVFVLVATPLVRVLTGIYFFRRDGERTMTIVTSVVLALLLVGILVLGPLIR